MKIANLFKVFSKATAELDEKIKKELKQKDPDNEKAKAILSSLKKVGDGPTNN